MIGARARGIYDQEAKRRMLAGKKITGNPPDNCPEGSNVPVNCPEAKTQDSRDAVAAVVGVSGKSIDRATKVIKYGVPELVKAVDEGRIAVAACCAAATACCKRKRQQSNRLEKFITNAHNIYESVISKSFKHKSLGGMDQTVNLSTKVYGGSNPSLPTIKISCNLRSKRDLQSRVFSCTYHVCSPSAKTRAPLVTHYVRTPILAPEVSDIQLGATIGRL